MSWFDTSGLASLAKTALKEAQKQIDKALDIQDESNSANASSSSDHRELVKAGSRKLPGGANREKSKTEPTTPVTTPILPQTVSTATIAHSNAYVDAQSQPTEKRKSLNSDWGSFTGSFFENPNAKEMVTTPPKSLSCLNIEKCQVQSSNGEDATMVPVNQTKRQSLTSNSDSIELLSSPTSCSAITSPSEAFKSVSESVEQITTPTSSELLSTSSDPSLRDSIVIIGSDDAADDDSLSYSTIMEDTSTTAIMAKQESNTSEDSKSLISDVTINPTTPPPSQSATHRTTSTSSEAHKLLMSVDDMLFESQTVNSDSTQSFEDVQFVPVSSRISAANPINNQPPSSDDKSDLVKILSGHSSSDHNSNDEIDTTTSSDIEIISNPNGDSSSTNSLTRTSPSNLKKQSTATSPVNLNSKKGHFREPSEVSVLSEDSQSESDKFLIRISELNEIIEAREMRLVEFGRQNAELQERNHELQQMVDAMRGNAAHLDSTEEYTQRLSALEKKFQASIRERDALRIQLKALKDELETKIPKDDLTRIVDENNAMISALRTEGEKLSKEVLQQSNIIKKLRAKEKTSDSQLRKNKEQIDDLTEEVERLKKTLNAKEEVERSQIEAVHKMSSENRKLEEENAQQCSHIEDLQSKLSTLQNSFDAVKIELQQQTLLHTALTRAADETATTLKEKIQIETKYKEMIAQLNELREKLRASEQTMKTREQTLREENSALLQRLENSEIRAENLTHQLAEATRPLIRQLETLQTTLTQKTESSNKQEKELLEKLESSESRRKHLEDINLHHKDKIDLLNKRCYDLEEKLSRALMQEEKGKISFQQAELDFKRQTAKWNELLMEHKTKLEELENLKRILEDKLEAQRTTSVSSNNSTQTRAHRELNAVTSNDVTSRNEHEHDRQQRNHSPNHSLDGNSIEEEAMVGDSADWQLEDLDCVSSSGRQAAYGGGSFYGMQLSIPYLGHNASTLEHLQSLLKQRDGEVYQLQWELSRLQAERGVLNDEISNLTLEMELIKERLVTHETLERNFGELQHQYDALLQMYGEKVERTQELELDLLEAKEAYKAQIDELLSQSKNNV